MTPIDIRSRLHETKQAFDSVAADYDGPRGNNSSIQRMRGEMWAWLDRSFAPGSRLIDLGCGTGLDAVRMAGLGHRVVATDWSPQMVERTRDRAERAGQGERVRALHIGAHELERLDGTLEGTFDGAYSNLGPLNCVPDVETVAQQCARLVRPGGLLVFTVINRWCPWEVLHYVRQGRWERARVRFARETVAVGMNSRTIWTRYFSAREFYRSFAQSFTLEHRRGLCVFAPPPYLELEEAWQQRLWRADRALAGWPLLRELGDHFLIVMKRRGS
ncbi:MAG: methyltransferase domain-containing protein [Paucibacter sp.]|nr:methyltransferase domain-containing protein [Roseateles sp.]